MCLAGHQETVSSGCGADGPRLGGVQAGSLPYDEVGVAMRKKKRKKKNTERTSFDGRICV